MQTIINFIQDIYQTKEFIPLHEPRFRGNEKKYLNECIDSTFVSSVGKFVDLFEEQFASYVGAKYAVATVNGTSALHVALTVGGVSDDDEVITQALTFIATCNAISYCGAKPVFIDVDLETSGMSAKALEAFLQQNCIVKNGECINKTTNKRVKACVPMHTFGHPCEIDTIAQICKKWHIVLVEDSAESLGSFYKQEHTGTFGKMGCFSFNGNKIITSGGGGVVVTDDEVLAKKLKHLTTTAKVPHKWEYSHDIIGYNYRMPNLNAALLVAQLEELEGFLASKRELAQKYAHFFEDFDDIEFIKEPDNAQSNYWLNAITCKDKKMRDEWLEFTNANGVMTRPVWKLMSELGMFKMCQNDGLKNSKYLSDRVINIPSSVL
ncbi:LegC family aminotransferase [Sulfurimonas sediminis]|uniref:GDP-perosamine synthase n=1 Tax=Sulfurimonas sediminis TaxID=2590020 RepID=A0A7M1AYS9_9BACT|nr:LegC family aminotransferase [Sulfurimonas sediminis]QOP42601.1 LegC family aminotransferase [Sulfurimonas sediminis]